MTGQATVSEYIDGVLLGDKIYASTKFGTLLFLVERSMNHCYTEPRPPPDPGPRG